MADFGRFSLDKTKLRWNQDYTVLFCFYEVMSPQKLNIRIAYHWSLQVNNCTTNIIICFQKETLFKRADITNKWESLWYPIFIFKTCSFDFIDRIMQVDSSLAYKHNGNANAAQSDWFGWSESASYKIIATVYLFTNLCVRVTISEQTIILKRNLFWISYFNYWKRSKKKTNIMYANKSSDQVRRIFHLNKNVNSFPKNFCKYKFKSNKNYFTFKNFKSNF